MATTTPRPHAARTHFSPPGWPTERLELRDVCSLGAPRLCLHGGCVQIDGPTQMWHQRACITPARLHHQHMPVTESPQYLAAAQHRESQGAAASIPAAPQPPTPDPAPSLAPFLHLMLPLSSLLKYLLWVVTTFCNDFSSIDYFAFRFWEVKIVA